MNFSFMLLRLGLSGMLLLFTIIVRAAPPTLDQEGGIIISPATAALIEMANAGDADAANILGFQYGNGLSVMQNDKEALKWYRKAVELGSSEAAYNLGSVYRSGFGVDADAAQAAQWFRKAAEQDHAEAQNALGLAYETGQGVTQDYREAARWYEKAAQQNLAIAQEHLQRLKAERLIDKSPSAE